MGALLERGYLPIPLPKLYVVLMNKSLCSLDRLAVIGEVQMNRVFKVPVAVNDVGSIAGHDGWYLHGLIRAVCTKEHPLARPAHAFTQAVMAAAKEPHLGQKLVTVIPLIYVKHQRRSG